MAKFTAPGGGNPISYISPRYRYGIKKGCPKEWTARFLLMKKGPALKSACRLYEI
jgi:hypothetical protein